MSHMMLRRRFIYGTLLASAVKLTDGFALGNEMYFSFAFDLQADSQHAEILAYKLYSGSEVLLSYQPIDPSRGRYTEGKTQSGPRPTRFWVKWRDLNTNQEFTADADLRGKIPPAADNSTIYPMFDGGHLSIYLISPDEKRPDEPTIGPRMYRNNAATLIYSN